MDDQVSVEWDGVVCHLRLNRPAKANSLTAAMLEALIIAVESASANTNVLVLTGEGTVFSAGADLAEARAGLATSPLWERLSSAIAAFSGLSIASLNGTVAGGALGMVLACDIRVAVPEAKFFYPVMKLGFLPQPSDPVRLATLVGPARAAMILMAGERIDATEALSWGLVDKVVAPDDLAAEISRLSQDAAAAEPGHVAGIKSLIRSWQHS